MQTYSGSIADKTHFQFREFPNKTFAYNKAEERLDVSVCVCVVRLVGL